MLGDWIWPTVNDGKEEKELQEEEGRGRKSRREKQKLESEEDTQNKIFNHTLAGDKGH